MPGRSRASGLGSSARTITARVTGSTRESIVVMVPSKRRSGHAAERAPTASPGASALR